MAARNAALSLLSLHVTLCSGFVLISSQRSIRLASPLLANVRLSTSRSTGRKEMVTETYGYSHNKKSGASAATIQQTDDEFALEDGEEELGTIDISPEEIAEHFAQPSYTATKAGGKALPGMGVPLLEADPRHVFALDGFLPAPLAKTLRGIFDDKFAAPREGSPDRFVWDYWHVPDQYTLLRTPAENYFGNKAYEALTAALCTFGQEQLGCRAISPPWLSVYVDGCEQRMHTDSWHGPWAYVLSLTDWEGREFVGGETQILKPNVLNYWQSFVPGVGLEEKHFMDLIEPRFNRLALFDPRYPHGVKPVRGTRDPRKGRLVLHGWFTDPQPYFSGGLSEDEATEPLNRAMEKIGPTINETELGRVTGVLTVRLTVNGKSGAVKKIVALTDTLVIDPNEVAIDDEGMQVDTRQEILSIIDEILGKAVFPPSKSGKDTIIVVPFQLE